MAVVCNSEKNRFAKECLHLALKRLMKQKNLRDITVTELTETAGVSRMAFYRNYHSILDVVREILLYDFFGGDLTRDELQAGVYEHLVLFFLVLEREKEFLSNLVESGFSWLLMDASDAMCTRLECILGESGLDERYSAAVFSGVIFKLVVSWLSRNTPDSPQSMAALTYDILLRLTRQP